MSAKRDVSDYLNDILEAIADIRVFTKGLRLSDFIADKKTNLAVIRCFEIIGEAVKKVPVDTRELYPGLPWAEVAGMRDKLIHDYFGVDLEIVWTTVLDDLDPLEESVLKLLGK